MDQFADDTNDSDPIVQADILSHCVLVRHKSGRVFIVHLATGPTFKAIEVERDRVSTVDSRHHGCGAIISNVLTNLVTLNDRAAHSLPRKYSRMNLASFVLSSPRLRPINSQARRSVVTEGLRLAQYSWRLPKR